MQSLTPVHPGLFYHDGRGPELLKVHYGQDGLPLLAIDFVNSDYEECDNKNIKHILFVKPQVFMFTPEEVFNYAAFPIDWAKYGKAALFCLGRSPWVLSFAPRHLIACSHFRAMFYDEFLDVICEGIEVREGRFRLSP